MAELRQQLRISVVIPTFRRPDALRATLRSVTAVEHPAGDYEVVVVDDGSGDETGDVVREFEGGSPRVVYVEQQNSGVAATRNHGARVAEGELLIFLDDDTLVEPDHIAAHLATREAHGDCLVNGHRPFTPEVHEALEATPFGRFRIGLEDWINDNIAKRPLGGSCVVPEGVTACNLGISRELFMALGGFDESFPMAGAEDQEFSHRAGRAGCSFVYNYDIRLLHNDERLTLAQFCHRQREEGLTKVHLARAHPESFREHPMIVENGPVTGADRPALRTKKAVKRLLSRAPALALVHRSIALVERAAPRSRLLRRAYWGVLGLHIYLGVQEGLSARHGPGADQPASAPARA